MHEEKCTYFEAPGAAINRDWAPLRGVLRDGDKFIQLPLPELYDLESDPRELDNRLRTDTDTVRALRRLLPEASVWPPSGASTRNLSEAEAKEQPLQAIYVSTVLVKPTKRMFLRTPLVLPPW